MFGVHRPCGTGNNSVRNITSNSNSNSNADVPMQRFTNSRSHHYAQLGNSALIMGNLKGSTGRFFNFIAQSQNFPGIWMGPVWTNLSKWSKINVNKKSWHTTHLKDNLTLVIFTKRPGWPALYFCCYVSSKLLMKS